MNTLQHRDFNLKILLILSLGHLVTDIYQGALPAILPFLKAKLSISYALDWSNYDGCECGFISCSAIVWLLVG